MEIDSDPQDEGGIKFIKFISRIIITIILRCLQWLQLWGEEED